MIKFEVGKVYSSAFGGEYAILVLKRTPKTLTVRFLQWWIHGELGEKHPRIELKACLPDIETFYVWNKSKKFGCGFCADDCLGTMEDIHKRYPAYQFEQRVYL